MKKQITLELNPEEIYNNELIIKLASKKTGISPEDISAIDYIKRSLDSRHKKNKYILSLIVYSKEQPTKEKKIEYKVANPSKKVIIMGAGPAGYFAALQLLEFGIKPIIFERGKDVRERRKDIKDLLKKGNVNPQSNYCFGEGGAGAYSDGKIYTRSDKRGDIKKILKIFVDHGANPDIMIEAYPHIGSDKLPNIIAKIRETIINYGGEVHFNSLVTNFEIDDSSINSIIINNENKFSGSAYILATGHSARDIYYLLDSKRIFIESKPFAIGFRVEHYQEQINEIQYGKNYNQLLPPASYKLVTQVNNNAVFSFCMCPGGIIVPAVSAPRELVVNGMSSSKRNLKFANSGIVTTVSDKDFSNFNYSGNLAGLKFQEALERLFFTDDTINPLKAPSQRLIDFVRNKKSTSLMESSYIPGLIIKDLYSFFPERIKNDLQEGIKIFDKKMKGFLTKDANAIGLESRTSSPIRITRLKEKYHHVQITNLFPCGEGSGYAGGIISAAIDGQNCAKAIIDQFFN